MTPPSIDLHQHLWPEPLLAALSRRTEPPMLVRRGEAWHVRTPGEPDVPVVLADHDPDARLALLARHGVDQAVIAPSVPLGIEALDADAAAQLLAAYHEGAAALPSGLRAWAAVGLAEPDPAGLARLLDGGFAGACVAADALSGPEGYDHLGPVLRVLEDRGAPLFVHPGPSPRTLAAGDGAVGAERPSWWPAVTTHIASMHGAWHAFVAFGRPAHPGLRVCFAMLAGLAPLQRERLVARGGPRVSDPDVFVDTSSYGAHAIDAVIRELGVDRLVLGTDVPVIGFAEPALGDAVALAVRVRNPARLLTHTPPGAPA
ncbi:MAG: 6-methylsalicylate decarboxylase [Baekduia sp.]|nr:6-methylsalicylate decarboxylase [Baekduia sp.]